MTELKMKCPECLHEFEGATNNLITICPNCAKEINTNQAVKYYQSLKKIETENQKVAEGEKYIKLNALLDECKWLLDNGEFESALVTTDMALELSTTDSRVYLMRVYAKTKNFTDYEESSHFSDLKKAIELSTTQEKEDIKKIYSPYHKKRSIPKEEFEEYENQEATSKLKKVESLLKDGIPKHFAREKSLKPLLILNVSSAVVFIALFILSLILNNVILSICASLAFVITFGFFSTYLSRTKRVNLYNAVLDLYDNLNSFDLKSKSKLNLSISLEKFAVAYLNNESNSHAELLLFEMLEYLVENEKAIAFIKSHKTFKKYI